MGRFNSAAAIVVLGIGLSGCYTTFDPRGCPKERKYTRAEQSELAAALPATPPIVKLAMVDYGLLRDKARACRGE